MTKFRATDDQEFTSIDYTDRDGNAQTLSSRSGVFTADDALEIEVARAHGLEEIEEAEPKASKATKKAAPTPLPRPAVPEFATDENADAVTASTAGTTKEEASDGR